MKHFFILEMSGGQSTEPLPDQEIRSISHGWFSEREIFQLVPNAGLSLEKPFEPRPFLSHVSQLLNRSAA